MSEVRKLISRDTLLANSKNGRLKDLGELYHDITPGFFQPPDGFQIRWLEEGLEYYAVPGKTA